MPLESFPSIVLVKDFMANINSKNSVVIAARAESNFSPSIRDSTKMEAVNTPIAVAIVINVFALRFCCHAFNESFTPSKIPVMPSNIPPALPAISEKLSIIFLIPSAMAVNIPPFTKSRRLSKFALSTAEPIAPPRWPKASPNFSANLENTGESFLNTFTIASNTFLNPLNIAVIGANFLLTLLLKSSTPLVSTFLNPSIDSLILVYASDIFSFTLSNTSPKLTPVSF